MSSILNYKKTFRFADEKYAPLYTIVCAQTVK